MNVAEIFGPVIQGEGASSGIPAYFIRVGGCNLMSIGVKGGSNASQPKIACIKAKNQKGGVVNMQDIVPGDTLWSVDEDGKLCETEVKASFEYELTEWVELRIEGVKKPLYCSLQHPWMTNEGWKLAGDLREGDELMHSEWSDRQKELMKLHNPMKDSAVAKKSAENTDYSVVGTKVSTHIQQQKDAGTFEAAITKIRRTDPQRYKDFCTGVSERMLKNNPMRDPSVVRSSNGCHQNINEYFPYMSKSEKIFADLMEEQGLDFEYTGRFSLPVTYKNKTHYPDFYIPGTNTVVEVFWGGSKKPYGEARGEKYKQDKFEAYSANGYRVAFADFTESKNSLRDMIKTELTVQNGRKVESIRYFYHSPSNKGKGITFDSKHRRSNTKIRAFDITCSPHNTFIVDNIVTHNCGGKDGELVKAGKAKWHCDSEAIWKNTTEMSSAEIIEKIKQDGELDRVLRGSTHLIFTGGEPCIPKNAQAFCDLLDYIEENYPMATPYTEVETNGTLLAKDFLDRVTQINCSVKLSNSGEPSNKRLVPKTLNYLRKRGAWFKLVIAEESDWDEVKKELVKRYRIPEEQIMLMPAGKDIPELMETGKVVWNIACRENLRMCSRLHVYVWRTETGK